MISPEDSNGLDGATLIPIDLGGSLVTRNRVQCASVLELGKKLLQSAREGDTAAVLDLMSKGAPFTTDWLGTSPLHLAAMNNHLETCEVLLRAGIGKDGRTKVDRTPLHFAAYEGHAEVARLLLENGVEVNCKDMLQMTPLHWAVERGHEECVLVLLSEGANPRAESKFMKTPLSIAVEMSWDSMVEILQSNTTREATMSIQENPQEMEQIPENRTIHNNITNFKQEKLVDDIEISQDMDAEIDQENEAQNNLASLLPQGEEYTNEATLQLLKEHGITMIPADNTNTVTSALQSGRRIVLSDAGKLILKDSKFQMEPPKPMEIKTKPIILPTGKIKSTKIYTMSSSQFLAMTGQSKPNILQKVPIELKKENSGINLVQLPKTTQIVNMNPNLTKTINIVNKSPVKQGSNTITLVKQGKGNILSIKGNTISKVPGNINFNTLTNQGKKTKLIQLKSGTTLGNAVKIVVNKNSLGKFVAQIPSTDKKITNGVTSITEESLKTLKDGFQLVPKNTASTIEIEKLKLELRLAKLEAEDYKKKYHSLQNELQSIKNKFKIKTLSTNNILND